MTYPFKVNSKEDIYKLCKLASEEDFNVYLSTSTGVLDAKSLLGLFTALGKDVKLIAPDHADAEKFSKFIEKLLKAE